MNLEISKCSMCTEYCTISKDQFHNRRSICAKCYEKVIDSQLRRLPHRWLLQYAAEVEGLLPCKNSALGCEAKLKRYQMKDDHELNCPYELVKCPTSTTQCSAIMQIKDLGAHLAKNHNCTVIKTYKEQLFMNIDNIFDKCKTREYYMDLENGPKFLISFIVINYHRRIRKLHVQPLHIHSGDITGESEHYIDILLKESNPDNYRSSRKRFIFYDSEDEDDYSEQCLLSAIRKNENEPKSVMIFFNVQLGAKFQS